jgi:hypothetical protein
MVLNFGKPTEDPLSDPSLLELAIYSAFSFIFAALFLQFLYTLQTAILLNHYSITFQYSLFNIHFTSFSNTKWPIDRLYLVYGLGTIIYSVGGLFLTFLLRNLRMAGWKIRLALTWMAFLMVYTLPASIIAGSIFFTGFGMAYQWLIKSLLLRCIIVVVVLILMVLYRNFWLFLFLKTSYTKVFLTEIETQKVYIRNIFINPLIFGFFILLIYISPKGLWYWMLSLLSLFFLAIPSLNQLIQYDNLFIKKSDKRIFTSTYSVFFKLFLLFLIWVVSFLKIDF